MRFSFETFFTLVVLFITIATSVESRAERESFGGEIEIRKSVIDMRNLITKSWNEEWEKVFEISAEQFANRVEKISIFAQASLPDGNAAMNYPNPENPQEEKIEFSSEHWPKYQNSFIMRFYLVFHEYLSFFGKDRAYQLTSSHVFNSLNKMLALNDAEKVENALIDGALAKAVHAAAPNEGFSITVSSRAQNPTGIFVYVNKTVFDKATLIEHNETNPHNLEKKSEIVYKLGGQLSHMIGRIKFPFVKSSNRLLEHLFEIKIIAPANKSGASVSIELRDTAARSLRMSVANLISEAKNLLLSEKENEE